jgi:PAS domain S-box-containing protein
LFGYTAGEIIGQSISLLTPLAEAPEQAAVRARLWAGGSPEHFETTRRRKDGSLVGVLITDSAALDEEGNVVGLSVVAHDISVRRKAQAGLEVSERRLAQAQRIAHLGSFELDVVTGELTWSEEHYRILGLDLGLEPTADLFVSMVHPDDRPRLDQAWASATERGMPFDLVYRIIRGDFQERWVRSRAVPQMGEDGTVVKMVGTLMDETERVEAARDRQLLLSQLVTAQEQERQRIASDIHDDSLQKVAAASMRLDMLRADHPELKDDEGFTKAQSMLRRSIDSMRHLMFNLRPYALDQAGLIPALRLYLEEESKFDGSPGFHLQGQLSIEPSPDVRIILYRIVQEALVNVRKHARASRVEVWVGEEDAGYLVRVTDDGVGFDAGEGARSPKGHLGITTMRERAELAAGWFAIRSDPGAGTAVEFWLPGDGHEQHLDE